VDQESDGNAVELGRGIVLKLAVGGDFSLQLYQLGCISLALPRIYHKATRPTRHDTQQDCLDHP